MTIYDIEEIEHSINKYPEDIMDRVREMLGLDEGDTSRDDYIMNTLTPNEVFDYVLRYEGIIGYSSRIIKWVDMIYGTTIEEDN